MSPARELLSFLNRPLSPNFERRDLTISPGGSHPFVETEWKDALVVIEQGAVEFECTRGGCRRFECGSILWLTGLPLVAIHNRDKEPVQLVAIRRLGDL